jgi:hypothetical protein
MNYIKALEGMVEGLKTTEKKIGIIVLPNSIFHWLKERNLVFTNSSGANFYKAEEFMGIPIFIDDNLASLRKEVTFDERLLSCERRGRKIRFKIDKKKAKPTKVTVIYCACVLVQEPEYKPDFVGVPFLFKMMGDSSFPFGQASVGYSADRNLIRDYGRISCGS